MEIMHITEDFILELTLKHQFTYLGQISFESELEKKAIREIGLDHWKRGQVSEEAEKLGRQFTDLIEKSFLSKVSIRWIDAKVGYGVFAEEEIEEGSFVGEYTGILRKNDLRRCFGPLNEYCAMYPLEDEMGKKFFLDGESSGNLTRFINHSYQSNLKPIQAFYDGFYHRIFIAEKKIEKGVQLLYSYGKPYWYFRSNPVDLI